MRVSRLTLFSFFTVTQLLFSFVFLDDFLFPYFFYSCNIGYHSSSLSLHYDGTFRTLFRTIHYPCECLGFPMFFVLLFLIFPYVHRGYCTPLFCQKNRNSLKFTVPTLFMPSYFHLQPSVHPVRHQLVPVPERISDIQDL